MQKLSVQTVRDYWRSKNRNLKRLGDFRMKLGLFAFLLLAVTPPGIAQATSGQSQTLGAIRHTFLNQNIIIGSDVEKIGGANVLLGWDFAKKTGDRYEDAYSQLSARQLPASFRNKTAKVVAIQLHRLPQGRAGAANALGERISEDDIVDPYFDLVVKFDDGTLAMTTTFPGIVTELLELASDHSKTEEEMSKNLPLAIGETVYAAGWCHLYPPETTLEDISDIQKEILHRLPLTAVPLLEPLQITAAKYIDSVNGVVLKLRLPNGQDALSFTSSLYLKEAALSKERLADTSFLSKVAGLLLVAIPNTLTEKEVDAIKKGTLFRGMSKDAVENELGYPTSENNWGSGGTQLIYSKSVFIYVDSGDKLVDWQLLSQN